MNEEKTCCSFQTTSGNASFLFPFANLLFLFQNTSDMVQRKRFLLMVCTLKGSARVHCWPGYYVFSSSGPLEHMGIVGICPHWILEDTLALCQSGLYNYVYCIDLSPINLTTFRRAWILVFFLLWYIRGAALHAWPDGWIFISTNASFFHRPRGNVQNLVGTSRHNLSSLGWNKIKVAAKRFLGRILTVPLCSAGPVPQVIALAVAVYCIHCVV